jgi:hypothetical protein
VAKGRTSKTSFKLPSAEGANMEESSRTDIRRLLKSFGVQADEAIITHLARASWDRPLRIRLVLQDLTDYGSSPPEKPLYFEIDGEIRP